MSNDISKSIPNNNRIEINGATYIVERSFGSRKTLHELLAQRVVAEKKNDDAAKQGDINDIA